MDTIKKIIRSLPVIGPYLARLYWRSQAPARPGRPAATFAGSGSYWEKRYAAGDNSGVGSYGKFAAFKAEFLNDFVARHGVHSVMEFGCGDGNQLTLASYADYAGFDVSQTAVDACRARFAGDSTRRFALVGDYRGETAELTLSLDVLYHLVEDSVFEDYMARLFDAATRFVIVYSSNTDDTLGNQSPHVRHRQFSQWVADHRPHWRLVQHVPNLYPYQGDYRTGSFADFYVFERT